LFILSFIKIDLPKKQEENLVKISFYNENQKTLLIKKFKKKQTKIKKGQVVDIAKPKIEKEPQKTNLLSKYNSSVKKQTTSKEFDKNINIRGKN